MTREAWFCPACQKHHAPHVETCPGPGPGTGTKPMETVVPVLPSWIYQPSPTVAPGWWQTPIVSTCIRPDPRVGVSRTRAN